MAFLIHFFQGKYKVKADVKEDATGNRLFCIDLAFEIA
jgi:hypothetical protein